MKIPGGFGSLRRSFAIRDYRLFVIGNLTSNIGLWTQRVALLWLTWDLTHSPAWLGAMAIVESAPMLLFAPIAGAIVDRVDYFKLLRFTQSLSLLFAVILAALTLGGWMNIWFVLAIVLARGTVTAFNRTSRMTVIFTLVGRDMLATAVALNSVIFNISRFLGPAVGGSLIVFGGVGWTFAVAAGLFFVFTVTLHMIGARIAPPPEREHRSMVAEMAEGLRYMLLHDGIRVQIVMLVIIGFLAKPLSDMLPGFVGNVFGRGPEGLAILTSSYGAGAMLGAFYMASRDKGVSGLTAISIAGVLVIGLGTLLFVATPVFIVGCVAIFIIGLAAIMQNVANQTLIQTASDPAMRGRVISNHGLVQHSTPAIGALIMGAIAEHAGLRPTLAVGAVICVSLWIWVWRQRHMLVRSLEASARD
ncbi:MAG: hypothetical protein RL477_1115 [Pseudomonadota bacterium]